jgi:hypothetical protein
LDIVQSELFGKREQRVILLSGANNNDLGACPCRGRYARPSAQELREALEFDKPSDQKEYLPIQRERTSSLLALDCQGLGSPKLVIYRLCALEELLVAYAKASEIVRSWPTPRQKCPRPRYQKAT